MSARRKLGFALWPEADRAMWAALVRNGDLLDGRGPFAHLRPATIGVRRTGYAFWLGFLADQGADLSAEPPSARVSDARLWAYLASLEGLSPGSQAQRVVSLHLVLRAAAPRRDWSRLAAAAARLQRIEGRRSRTRSAAAQVSAMDLAALGLTLIDEAERMTDLDPVLRAVRARDGAAICALACFPLRIGNFAALEIGRTLIDLGDAYAIRIEPEAAKAGRAIEAVAPEPAGRVLRVYLERHRPALATRRSGRAVWLAKSGVPYSAYKFSERIATVTAERLGVRVSAHRFRTCAAATIAELAPERAEIIRALLAHSTAKVGDRAYNQASMRRAVKAHQDALRRAMRERTRRR